MSVIFIFRRDLRIQDNRGLQYAASLKSGKVLPIFIFTPTQISNKNKYRSANAIHFMTQSLQELDTTLRKQLQSRLHIFNGENIPVLKSICKRITVNAIVFNEDYTPYAIHRDSQIINFCKRKGIACHPIHDYLLQPMGTLLKSSGDPYTVFTPFLNNATRTTRPDKPATRISGIFGSSSELRTLEGTYPIQHEYVTSIQPGGRRAALQQLAKAVRTQKNYAKNHNKLTIQTSRLSAYIKFGCVSIREVYWKVRPIRSQLYWREFYYYIVKYFPRVLSGSANFNTRIKPIAWNTSASDFKAWCSGTTGYPIVDAGMRQLNTTGYMHNRARLITANFLNRILNIDWRKGEQYYAQQLTDYDPAINNGNWQWIASTGVDPKPYNQRLFNPWLQSQKFDPQAEYIKKWVPELNDVPVAHIHHWSEYAQLHSHATKYPQPIVDYEFARKRSLSVYKKSFT